MTTEKKRDPSILIAEDNPAAATYMRVALSDWYSDVRVATDGLEALLEIEKREPEIVISDLHMPRLDGLGLLQAIRQRWPGLPFVLATVEHEIGTVVRAVRLGAANYLVKPVTPEGLRGVIESTLGPEEQERQPRIDSAIPEIIGTSRPTVELRQLIALAARSTAHVLVTGESGTGKELVTGAIHRLSELAEGPLLTCSCGLVQGDRFDAELFGENNRPGLLERTDGGSLVLDGVDALQPTDQSKLLGILDDGRAHPPLKARVLATTNRDPSALVEAGLLRHDLYYRLGGLQIDIPALRERTEDIPPLATHFLPTTEISPEALERLRSHRWPGNVRQLRNVLLAADKLAAGSPIEAGHLRLDAPEPPPPGHKAPPSSDGRRDLSLRRAEREAILQALQVTGGKRGEAAEMLGIDRSTLRRKLRELDLENE